MKYIELFAGCGGLSLGLKSLGFELVMANELSPMAAESYALNFFNEDLQKQAESKTPLPTRTVWLNSNYPISRLKDRLRENPFCFPALNKGYSDISQNGFNLKNNLVVGSIVDLNVWLTQNPEVARLLRYSFENQEVDLVSGGPPCQSFSMAGLRRQDCAKNSLPWEFAKFVSTINPKLVLLENVTGILRPFKDESGKEYFAWFELAKAFSIIGYVPLCLHVNAKLAGVPQNRPRFILLGVRKDYFDDLKTTFNSAEHELFSQPSDFYDHIKQNQEVNLSMLRYWDVAKSEDLKLFTDSFLAPLVSSRAGFVSVYSAIDDLKDNNKSSTEFSRSLKAQLGKVLLDRPMKNHDLRKNGVLVRRRFRIYQVLQQVSKDTQRNIGEVLKGNASKISPEDWRAMKAFEYLVESGKFVKFRTKQEFVDFLLRHKTKKQTQKALISNQPAPAALSIPDDACHYDELRTLTVREMARIQSFPDNFEFRSKVTTGGKMRAFEVPQYTQVGNAVPPLLGRALGLLVKDLLSRELSEEVSSELEVPLYAQA